jgi:hypothetical protein
MTERVAVSLSAVAGRVPFKMSAVWMKIFSPHKTGEAWPMPGKSTFQL